ncbi:MAG: DUF1573 domain-containing protein [bacterium]|nr:DUF1573 domain-containing protein [bacterium]
MKKNTYIITAVIAVILLGAGYLWGQIDYSDAQAGGKLEIAEPDYDFGVVGLDPVSHTYTIKNTGLGSITIAKVATSCGCTTATLKKGDETSIAFGMDHGQLPKANFTLKPNEEAEVIATYNPLAHGPQNAKGTFDRVVYLKTENPRDEYELTFKVVVDPDKIVEKTPKIELNSTEYSFGKIAKTGGVVSTSFDVKNSGSSALVISDITTSCGCTTAEISSKTIQPNATAELKINFDPNFHEEAAGELERIVTLSTNDPAKPKAEVKVYAEIVE